MGVAASGGIRKAVADCPGGVPEHTGGAEAPTVLQQLRVRRVHQGAAVLVRLRGLHVEAVILQDKDKNTKMQIQS